MSDRNAPAVVLATDHCAAVLRETAAWTLPAALSLGLRLNGVAQDVLGHLAVALGHPVVRRRHIRLADEALAVERVLIAVARVGGQLPPARAAALADECAQLGRMIGGWRRYEDRERAERPQARRARRFVGERRRQDALGEP